ncbi:carbohydrate binding domain-containing protein, partial [Treponema sp.]|uniref:carbohydrate binding domain-containing protein n=1 Tax=Treponema sp. TaxID=166 RepID=UPI0025D6A383
HIENVRLEKTGEIDFAANGKACLPDGNYIFNGQFQEGKHHLGEWEIINNAKAEISVTKDRAKYLCVTSPKNAKAEDVIVKQSGIKLEKGKAYVIKFDAYSSKTTSITARFAGLTKTERVLPLPAAKKGKAASPNHYQWNFIPEEDMTIDFELLLGSNGNSIYVDNVYVKENAVLSNGSFERKMTGWELYAHQNSSAAVNIIESENSKQASVTIDRTGNLDWMIQLKQNGCLLEKGKKYKISLKAKSDLNRTIMLALQRDGSKDDNWYPYSNTLRFEVTQDFKDYQWTFVMGGDTDPNVIFTISMGAVSDKIINTKHTIVFDDIKVEEIDASKK